MMTNVVLRILKISLSTSLLIGLLLLLLPVLQKRYPAKWRYLAWIFIAVRLLVPVHLSLPQAPISIQLPEQMAVVSLIPPTDERPLAQIDYPAQMSDRIVPFSHTSEDDAGALVRSVPITPMHMAGIVWAIGVVAFLLFQLISYQVFLYKLRSSQKQDVPNLFKETIWRIGVEMGICRLPKPLVTGSIDAPVLIGVLHPHILLPHTAYTDEELSFILRHELVHYRRRDMWYKLVLMLANALHWFNPLVYLMTLQASKDIELACDDDVIRALDRDARARYGDTILASLPRKRRLEPVFSTHFGSTKKNIKGRLQNLFDMTIKRRGIAALCALGVCALLVTGMVTFAYAAAGTADIPHIGEEFNFSVPSIEPGEVVCVGKVELGPGISYGGTFSVENGSDTMLGLYDQPDVTRSAGIGWNQSFGGTGSKIWFSSSESKTMYVYVGSRNNSGTRLLNVSGSLQIHRTEAAQDAQKPLPDQSVFNNSTSANLSVQQLGQYALQQGDTVKTNLRWNDTGTVMVLHTDKDYTYDEILAALQGIQGIPKPDYSKVDREKIRGALNFTQSAVSPLAREQKVTQSGSYYFYIIQYGFKVINPLTGSVNRVDASGISHALWESAYQNALAPFDYGIHARGGTWAAATEIEGSSAQKRLDAKGKWLADVYAEHKTRFVISETIPESEITNTADFISLYNASEVYRTMSQMQNNRFELTNGGTFSAVGLPAGQVYERTGVMLDSDRNITLDAQYQLSEGEMALWLVNPSGKIVYWDDMAKSFDEKITVQGAKGLWSVITVSEPKNGAVTGSSKISLIGEDSALPVPTSTLDEDGTAVTNLTFDVTAANIIVRFSEDDNFHYEYNSKAHNVNTSGSGASKTITITVKERDSKDFSGFITIKIPNHSYQQITYRGNAAGLNLPAINANIAVDVSSSSCVLPIPSGYNKTCMFSINASSGILQFEKGVNDYVFALDATAAAPLLPAGWPAYQYGRTYTHSIGSGQGKINATVNASSFIVEDTEPNNKQPEGTMENPAAFDMTDPDVKDDAVIDLRNNKGQKNLVHSSSFQADAGQTLTITVTSGIKGGTVDLFLFSPSGQEQHLTFGGTNTTKTVKLSAGRWAYNCTGFFESGDIAITGTITNATPDI